MHVLLATHRHVYESHVCPYRHGDLSNIMFHYQNTFKTCSLWTLGEASFDPPTIFPYTKQVCLFIYIDICHSQSKYHSLPSISGKNGRRMNSTYKVFLSHRDQKICWMTAIKVVTWANLINRTWERVFRYDIPEFSISRIYFEFGAKLLTLHLMITSYSYHI